LSLQATVRVVEHVSYVVERLLHVIRLAAVDVGLVALYQDEIGVADLDADLPEAARPAFRIADAIVVADTVTDDFGAASVVRPGLDVLGDLADAVLITDADLTLVGITHAVAETGASGITALVLGHGHIAQDLLDGARGIPGVLLAHLLEVRRARSAGLALRPRIQVLELLLLRLGKGAGVVAQRGRHDTVEGIVEVLHLALHPLARVRILGIGIAADLAVGERDGGQSQREDEGSNDCGPRRAANCKCFLHHSSPLESRCPPPSTRIHK
jgi:hypothetical protein